MRDSLLDSRGCSRKVSFVLEQSGTPFPARGLIILVTMRPELSAILNCDTFDLNGFEPSFYWVNLQVLRRLVASRCKLEMLQWIHGSEKFMLHEPGVFI